MTKKSIVDEALDSARHILDMEENWDDYGAPRISFTAWSKAAYLLHNTNEVHLKRTGKEMPKPYIYPCGNGSVDIEFNEATLLIGVPEVGNPTYWYEVGPTLIGREGEIEIGNFDFILVDLSL